MLTQVALFYYVWAYFVFSWFFKSKLFERNKTNFFGCTCIVIHLELIQ